MVGERASAFHHADGFDAHASTTDHFYIFEFFFDQFDNCIILGCCLNKFKEQTVFAIINDSGFEGFCNLKKFYFIGSSTFLDFALFFAVSHLNPTATKQAIPNKKFTSS